MSEACTGVSVQFQEGVNYMFVVLCERSDIVYQNEQRQSRSGSAFVLVWCARHGVQCLYQLG